LRARGYTLEAARQLDGALVIFVCEQSEEAFDIKVRMFSGFTLIRPLLFIICVILPPSPVNPLVVA
jgi:hypothetical protein